MLNKVRFRVFREKSGRAALRAAAPFARHMTKAAALQPAPSNPNAEEASQKWEPSRMFEK